MLLMSACGNDKKGEFVTGKYYNPGAERAEEAAQEKEPDAGAGGQQEEVKVGVGATDTEDGQTIAANLFLITGNDMQAECLILEQLASGKQYMYNYSLLTSFLDKYGNRASVANFVPGRIICVGKKDIQGKLLEAQLSDAVWEYPDVTRFSVDEERGVLEIAGTNYSCDADVFIHSDGNAQQLSDLTALDTLRVVGIDKKILSISITTGHGELELENTGVFKGSYIQIGTKIFSEITGDTTLEVPEGTYTVAVANNGYGGSTEVEIKRGQKTVLDLNSLKGDGPKYGKILFAVDVAGAVLQIDGKTVDYSEPVDVRYGVHTLTVTADAYDPYSKKLFVNSEKATIAIGLTGDSAGGAAGAADDTAGAAQDEGVPEGAGDLAGSLAGSHGVGSAGNEGTGSAGGMSEAELDAKVNELLNEVKNSDSGSNSDYLSTINKILSSLAE